MVKLSLSREEKDYVNKVTPICSTISRWTKEKFIFVKRKANYLHPVVVLAHILVESQWGTHPLSQQFYNKKYTNNLALLEVDDLWQGKIIKYNDKSYKTYQSWIHFATDYSDAMVFAGDISSILTESSIAGQVDTLAALKENPQIYKAKIESLIEVHNLQTLFTKNFS